MQLVDLDLTTPDAETARDRACELLTARVYAPGDDDPTYLAALQRAWFDIITPADQGDAVGFATALGLQLDAGALLGMVALDLLAMERQCRTQDLLPELVSCVRALFSEEDTDR